MYNQVAFAAVLVSEGGRNSVVDERYFADPDLRRILPTLTGTAIMLFVIHALDRAGALKTRLANYEAHKAFLADTTPFGVTIVMSGPLVADDGSTMIGSLFVVEAADRAAVERFNGADPFHKADIWERVTITGFLRRQG